MDRKDICSSFTFIKVEDGIRKGKQREGVLTIVYSEKKNEDGKKVTGNGKRILFAKQLEKDLKLKDRIQIAITDDGKALVLGALIDSEQPFYGLKRVNAKKPNSRLVLYNSKVIGEIIKKLHLDYTDKVSITFYGIEYIEDNDIRYAKVWLEGEL